MAHRIGGRKLSRKQGPRKALFKNLTVSVIRYEKVKTTEAKAKEISGQVEKVRMIAHSRAERNGRNTTMQPTASSSSSASPSMFSKRAPSRTKGSRRPG